MPVFRKDLGKLFTKVIISKGSGFRTPQAGSVCKIKVVRDEMNQVLGLDESDCKELTVEDADERMDIIIEDCMRTMKVKEECSIEILSEQHSSDTLHTENYKKVNKFIEKTHCNEIQILLLSFSEEPEIWQMAVSEKWRRAQHHHQRGKNLYEEDLCEYGFRHFGLTLKYLISLEQNDSSEFEGGMDVLKLKLFSYLNLAACQMRNHNYESAAANASKALDLQPSNVKALFRRGVAYLRMQEYEKAAQDLTSANNLNPSNSAIIDQLQILRLNVQKLNRFYANVLKKMFS